MQTVRTGKVLLGRFDPRSGSRRELAPAPLEDCWDALNWAAQEHASVPLMVGGDSSGGNLAAVCALRARDRGGPALSLQVLVYPVTDHAMTTASFVEHATDALVGSQEMRWFWDHYVVDVAHREDAEVSPLRAPDMSKLPPAVMAVAEYDPLRDHVIAYAQRLRAAGTDVTLRRYDDMFHGFFSMVNVFERATRRSRRSPATSARRSHHAQAEYRAAAPR